MQKKIKAEESVTFQNIFSSLADFRDVVSVLPAARLATKTLLIAFISQAAGSTNTTSRKSAIEEKMFQKVILSSALIFFCKRYLQD